LAKIVPLTLDKERHLCYDGNAMARWSKETKHKITDQVQLGDMDYTELRALLWASLAGEDKTLTVEQAGALMDVDNLAPIFEALADAVSPLAPPKTISEPSPESTSA
jgi:hypothetical protein